MVGSVSQYGKKIYEEDLTWLRNLLASTKVDVRQLVAQIYGIITAQLPNNDFEARISEIMNIVEKKNVEAQHGSLLALTYMMERRLTFSRDHMNNDFFNWGLYVNVLKMICTRIFLESHVHVFFNPDFENPFCRQFPS